MSKGTYTTSISRGNVAKDHDERILPAGLNIDPRLSVRNVYAIRFEETYKNLVNDFFHEATVAYNEKQERYRHRDRMIENDDYYTALLEGKTGFGSKHKERNKDGVLVEVNTQEQPIFEYVVGIGNRDTLGITDSSFDYYLYRDLKRQGKQAEADAMVDAHLNHDPALEDMKDVLVELAQELPTRFPQFRVWLCAVHMDEPGSAPHMHLAFSAWTEGGKNGMSKRVSLSRALSSMGYKNKEGTLAIEQWQNDINAILEEKMLARGYERTVKNPDQSKGRKHEETSVFVARNEAEYWSEKKEELQAECIQLDEQVATLEAKIDEVKKTTSGLTVAALNQREADLRAQANEQDAVAAKQAEVQAALTAQDEAYKNVVADYEDKANAYKDRYGQLFAGVQGLSERLSNPARTLLKEQIKGLQAMDSPELDRYGIKSYEDEISASEDAYEAAKQRLSLAVKDDRARVRRARTQKAAAASMDVESDTDSVDKELEF